MDFLKYGHSEMSDYAFEGPHLLKKRDAVTAMDRFNISESPGSFSKHQTSENDIDFMISNGASRPTLGRKFDFRDVTSQSDWFCFTTEDTKDNLSMLSEESSSSAVRGEATNNLLSNSAARQSRRHSNAFARPRKKGRDEIGQGNYVRGSGKCTNISNPSKSKPYYHCHSQEELGPNDSCSYEDGYSSVKMKSGFSSFSQNSEAKLPFSGSKIWTEDPSSELPVAGLDIDAKSSFDRSKYAEHLACSPSGSFISEKFTFHDSLIFSKDEFGPTISPDSKLKGTPLDSLHLAGSHGETPFPDAEESASRDVENEAKIQPARCKKLELIEEICNGNGLFSENKKAIDASSSGENNCGCKEENDESPEVMQNLETTYSPDHAEQVSMSLLISKKLGSIIEEQEHHHGNEVTLPCQNGNKELQDIGPQERRIARKTESNYDRTPRSCQVMMLESYVLQLLCVQKVLMDSSEQDTTKKV